VKEQDLSIKNICFLPLPKQREQSTFKHYWRKRTKREKKRKREREQDKRMKRREKRK
jgi:hypothetical protein